MPEQNNTLAEEIKKTEKIAEKAVEKVSEELHLGLEPAGTTPFGIRLITLLVLLGGVAIVVNIFSEYYVGSAVSVSSYVFRLVMGITLILIAYGLHRHFLWAVWLFGTATLVGFISNPILGIIPAAGVYYLCIERRRFRTTKQITLGTVRVVI